MTGFERLTIKWLFATLFLFYAATIIVGGSYAMSSAVKAGETPFTDAERVRLHELMPDGQMVGLGDFRNCENRHWMHYTPTHEPYWLAGEHLCW